MVELETALQWFYQREGKVSHSIAKRNGLDSYDSSSAVYYALLAADLLPTNTAIGNTDTLFADLEANGWEETSTPQRGCIFIWGRRGASSGEAGHTGLFVDSTQIIHCNKTDNTIAVTSYNVRFNAAGAPESVFYINLALIVEPDPNLTNVGELELFMIRNKTVVAEGWHYSYNKPNQTIQFVNAETDAVLSTVTPTAIRREDLAEQYPDQVGILTAGFHAELEIANGTAVYVRGIRSGNGNEPDVLTFPDILIYEQAYNIDVDQEAAGNEQFYIEVYDPSGNTLKKRIFQAIDGFSWSNELMYVPTTAIKLPITYLEYFEGRDEIKLYINGKVFHGIVMQMEINKQDESLYLDIWHVMQEWEYRQISTNMAVKSRTINDIYSTYDFRYPGWNMTYLDDAATRLVDYVYSRQSRLTGLTTTMELTDNLYWRVGFDFGRKVELGAFGEIKPYIVGIHSGAQHIKMIEAPILTQDYENVINIATVYGEKSDSGMSSLSLRDIYLEPGAQHQNFPVYILRAGINNERDYDYIEFSKLAPNNDLEYTVLDLESLAMEGGTVIEGTYSFNDIAPFNDYGEAITDEDRSMAARMAYEKTCKLLRNSRRRETISVRTERIPSDLRVGDRIRLEYDNELLVFENCSRYMKKIMNISDLFYITRIDYEFSEQLAETNVLYLEKVLHTIRQSDNQ